MNDELKVTRGLFTRAIIEFLERFSEDDRKLATVVREINAKGQRFFGENFRLRYDSTFMSKGIRDRAFLTRP